MLDAAVRRLLAPPVDRLVGGMARIGINPNTITVLGFLMGLGAAGFIADQQYAKGVFFLALNRFADILDGILARTKGHTALGGFLDAAMFLLVGMMVAAIPALAFRAFAQKSDELLVICGHSETFIALSLMCLAERWAFTPLAYFYGTLCFFSCGVSIISA